MSDDRDTAAGRERGPDILEEVDRLIASLQSHPDHQVREQVTSLLEGIDAVHRAGLTHLMSAIRGMAGDAFVNRLIADPAIRLLLMSYDLVAVDRRLQAEEAIDAVRGHLHGHGVDVEILEVVGGVIYVRLHGLDATGIAVESVRRDLEDALRAGLLGFQELVFRDRQAVDSHAGVIPLQGIRGLHRPVYHRAMTASDVPSGGMKGVEVDGQPVLVVNVDGDIHAVRNRCGDGVLPLEFSTLDGAELRCSWHGCRYDVRSGRRLDADGPKLQVFPVAIEGDEIRVAMDVEPLPAAR